MAPNVHHERAAKEIWQVISECDADGCPWRDLLHLLSGSPIQLHLARYRWQRNNQHTTKWLVDFADVANAVWGDPLVSNDTMRSNVSRLSTWLMERGVSTAISMNADADCPTISCEIISVDEAKIAKLLEVEQTRIEDFLKQRQTDPDARQAKQAAGPAELYKLAKAI